MPMMTPQGNHYHGSRLHQHCGSIQPSSNIYILKKKILTGLKNNNRYPLMDNFPNLQL